MKKEDRDRCLKHYKDHKVVRVSRKWDEEDYCTFIAYAIAIIFGVCGIGILLVTLIHSTL